MRNLSEGKRCYWSDINIILKITDNFEKRFLIQTGKTAEKQGEFIVNDIKPVIRLTILFLAIWSTFGILNILSRNSTFAEIRILPTLFLIGVSVFQIRYYDDRLSGIGLVRKHLLFITIMILLWIVLRGAKYYAFNGWDLIPRHIWYCYYIPMLMMSLVSLYAALYIGLRSKEELSKKWRITAIITFIIIVLILTNDLHQLAFSFNPGFADWNSDYSRGPVYFAAAVWSIILFVATSIIMVLKCRVAELKILVWIPVVVMLLWHLYILGQALGMLRFAGGYYMFEYPEAACFAVAAFWGYAIVIGIVPTNENYAKLLEECSLSVQLANKKYEIIYKSKGAVDLTMKQLKRKRYSVIDENTRLFRLDVTGGYGYWQQDISELNRLNEELDDVRSRLMDEAEIIRYENELKTKRVAVETRTKLYDNIAVHVQKQTEDISTLLKTAQQYPEHYDVCVSYACVIGAYIKRSANLMILGEQGGIPLAELRISMVESLRYLNLMGIPGDCIGSGDRILPAEKIVCMYDAFENLLETRIDTLKAVYVSLSEEPVPSMRMTLEGVGSIMSEELIMKMRENGLEASEMIEDDVCYARITFAKEGDMA